MVRDCQSPWKPPVNRIPHFDSACDLTDLFRKAQKCAVTSRVTPLKHAGKARETPHPEVPYPLGN
jgi:hypothetical protein